MWTRLALDDEPDAFVGADQSPAEASAVGSGAEPAAEASMMSTEDYFGCISEDTDNFMTDREQEIEAMTDPAYAASVLDDLDEARATIARLSRQVPWARKHSRQRR